MPENTGEEIKSVPEQLDTREHVMKRVKELRDEARERGLSALRTLTVGVAGTTVSAGILVEGMNRGDVAMAVTGGVITIMQGLFVFVGAEGLREASQTDNRANALEGAVVARVLAENESKQ